MSVRIEDWDTQKALDAANDNIVIAKLVANLNKEPAEIKRIKYCVNEIQKNNSWSHPVVLLEASTIPWPELKGSKLIEKIHLAVITLC